VTSTVFPCRRCGSPRQARNGDAVCRDCVNAPPGAHQPWMSYSACVSPAVDPEWWFPPTSAPAEAERAVEICRTCQVKDLCLDYAIQHGIDHGIWGGRSTPERNAISKARRRAC
jgi:WhiB family redox-sensing transcriptional regulator